MLPQSTAETDVVVNIGVPTHSEIHTTPRDGGQEGEGVMEQERQGGRARERMKDIYRTEGGNIVVAL